MHRQVRVVGRVERVAKEESWEYFKGRPIGSRLGAWASPQSEVVGEEEMKERLKEVQGKFGFAEDGDVVGTEVEVPVPDFWGGWRIIPEYVVSYSLSVKAHLNHVLLAVKSSSGAESRQDYTIVSDTFVKMVPKTNGR